MSLHPMFLALYLKFTVNGEYVVIATRQDKDNPYDDYILETDNACSCNFLATQTLYCSEA